MYQFTASKREEDTLALLKKFQKKLEVVKNQDSSVAPEDPSEDSLEDANNDSWYCLESIHFSPLILLTDAAADVDYEGIKMELSFEISRLKHSLKFEDATPNVARDANLKDDDWFEIYDPRNPLNKRRREESKKLMKEKGKAKRNDL